MQHGSEAGVICGELQKGSLPLGVAISLGDIAKCVAPLPIDYRLRGGFGFAAYFLSPLFASPPAVALSALNR